MRLALILSDFTERMRDLQRNLASDFSVVMGRSAQESVDLLQALPVDLVLLDLDSDAARGHELPDRIRKHRPHCAVVAVLPAAGAPFVEPPLTNGEPGTGYDVALRADSSSYEVSTALAQVLERQRLLEELARQQEEIRRLRARGERIQAAPAPAQLVDKTVKAFSRALSSGFDQQRLLELFADTVMEMTRVSRVSVLLHAREPGEYRVRCSRGLRPGVAEGLRLRAESGLAAWLAREGRIMTREMADDPALSAAVLKEMDALQARVSIPMMCSGVLAGVLNLNSRVTGADLTADEMETLFTLAGHVAVAVQDAGALRRMQHWQSCAEQILAGMGSGVIAIDDRERVVTCNRRAGEILGREPDDLLRRDLRRLPSPLGDMLYEAMRTGRRYEDEEVLLLPARVPLQVNVYRLQARDGQTLGSAAVIEDLRPRREKAERQDRADRLDMLQRLLGRMASEIQEPLARIQQFVETLPGAAESSEQAARDILSREMNRLDALGDRLSVLTEGLRYRFETSEITGLLLRGAELARQGAPLDRAVIETRGLNGAPARVRADREQLTQALSCLLRYAAAQAENTPVDLSLCAGKGIGDGAAPCCELHIRYRSRDARADVGCLLQPFAPDSIDPLGLGLPICRRVIADHGWLLDVSAEADNQVRIAIRLPTAAGPAPMLNTER